MWWLCVDRVHRRCVQGSVAIRVNRWSTAARRGAVAWRVVRRRCVCSRGDRRRWRCCWWYRRSWPWVPWDRRRRCLRWWCRRWWCQVVWCRRWWCRVVWDRLRRGVSGGVGSSASLLGSALLFVFPGLCRVGWCGIVCVVAGAGAGGVGGRGWCGVELSGVDDVPGAGGRCLACAHASPPGTGVHGDPAAPIPAQSRITFRYRGRRVEVTPAVSG